MSSRIEKKVYHGTAQADELRIARFMSRTGSKSSFELDGHRWAYSHTSFDDEGDFDLIYRWEGKPPKPANEMTSTDVLFACALIGVIANERLTHEVEGSVTKERVPHVLAGMAREIAERAADYMGVRSW